jgi:hypothetical protein
MQAAFRSFDKPNDGDEITRQTLGRFFAFLLLVPIVEALAARRQRRRGRDLLFNRSPWPVHRAAAWCCTGMKRQRVRQAQRECSWRGRRGRFDGGWCRESCAHRARIGTIPAGSSSATFPVTVTSSASVHHSRSDVECRLHDVRQVFVIRLETAQIGLRLVVRKSRTDRVFALRVPLTGMPATTNSARDL